MITLQACKNGADYIFSTAAVQVKELSFSTGIATHDLSTKLKQVESWLEKKHHVRITLRSGHNNTEVKLVRKSMQFSFSDLKET